MLMAWMVALLVLLDQATKLWIVLALKPIGSVVVIPGLLSLTYAENTGAFFSMLAGQQLFFVAITVVALGGIIWVLWKKPLSSILRIALYFILAGAIGNFIDRCLWGAVVDFFEFTFMNFAIFNVADMCITVGGTLFFCGMLFDKNSRKLLGES